MFTEVTTAPRAVLPFNQQKSTATIDFKTLTRLNGHERSYTAGQSILEQGERCKDVVILLEGYAICQKMLENGNRQILDLILPGDILGFCAPETLPYGLEAKTPCRVAILPQRAFRELLMTSPDVCLKCAETFARAETRALERLSQVERHSAKQRVAGFILEMMSRIRTTQSNAVEIPMTQIDIADMLGLAHETVCRVLVGLRKKGFATWRNGKLQVHSMSGLRAIIGDEFLDEDENLLIAA
jgi:CRP/FNR family transcriptional regulator, anaerobic regulatory protein